MVGEGGDKLALPGAAAVRVIVKASAADVVGEAIAGRGEAAISVGREQRRGQSLQHGSAGALSNAAIEAGIVEADPVRRMYEVGDGVGIRRGDGARHGEADSVVPGAAGQGGVQAGDRHVIAGTAIQSVGVRSAGDGVGQRCRFL